MTVSELISKLENLDQSLEVMHILDTRHGDRFAGRVIIEEGYMEDDQIYMSQDEVDGLAGTYPDDLDYVNMPRKRILALVRW